MMDSSAMLMDELFGVFFFIMDNIDRIETTTCLVDSHVMHVYFLFILSTCLYNLFDNI